jgi:trimethylamine corrinoid protein
MYEKFIKKYNEAVYDTNRAGAMQVIDEALAEGLTPEDIIFKLIVPAMEVMIKAISVDFDVNLAQHFMTAQIASEATDAMIARLDNPPEILGHIVIGAAAGDMHTLGKRIVIGCLKALRIEAVDIGVNVPPEKFVDEALRIGAPVIAISAMMSHTASGERGCLGVRKILKERNLEDQIKIIIGGAPFRFDPELYRKVGADATANDGIAAGDVVKQLMKEVGV